MRTGCPSRGVTGRLGSSIIKLLPSPHTDALRRVPSCHQLEVLIPNVHTGQPEPGAVNISSEGWRLTLVTAPEDVVQPHGDYIHLAVVRAFVFCRRAAAVVTDQP